MTFDRSLFAVTAWRSIGLATALAAASCGGGGDSAATSSAAATATATATPPAAEPAPTAAVAGSAATCGTANFATTALARLNQMRAAGADCRTGGRFAAAAAVRWNAQLTQAAERHTQDMLARDLFSHVGSDGSTLANRIDATGYVWRALGENIAAGQVGIDAVMSGWLASDGHCANLMNPDFAEVGLVCMAGNANTRYSTYWTLDLAKAR